MIMSTNPITPPDLIDDIRALVAAWGPTVSESDKAIVAIKYCISRGVDAGRHIIGCLKRAGFDNRRAGAILDDNTGKTAAFHWGLGTDGRYYLHEAIDA